MSWWPIAGYGRVVDPGLVDEHLPPWAGGQKTLFGTDFDL